MAEFTNRCFNYAQMERGPVQLNIPRDMFYGDVQVCPLLLLNQFCDCWSDIEIGRSKVKIPAPMETERSAGGPESIAEAANLLAGAKVITLQ